jgi:hypothetical protein
MTSWRDQILKEFTPQVARLTLVADPDGLLLEEGILQGIREKGFELIPFDDHIASREPRTAASSGRRWRASTSATSLCPRRRGILEG